mmetsp:Transcript_343/g.671  ORF Transcript_343/g.671 Transcript_343/m.671 type:complete len:221 (-) Transcript_343:31-693(-)
MQLPGVPASKLIVQAEGRLDPLLEVLPESTGGGAKLRHFWAVFVAMDFRPLLGRRKWAHPDFKVLEEARRRCVHCCYPFVIALELLQDSWHRGCERAEGSSWKRREAANAARTSAQWDALMAVQNLLGRLDAPSPSAIEWPHNELKRAILERRERYLALARAFQLTAALLKRVETTSSYRSARGYGGASSLVESACVEEVNALLAAQGIARGPLGEWMHS